MTGIDIKPDAQGKVRDLYDLGDKLLLVATDRISAFDYILEDEIPHKGAVLTQLSCFWFELLDGVVENHLISSDVADLPEQFQPYADYLRGRFMLVKKADMFPAECIVRGYLAGSRGGHDGRNGGDGEDLRVDILHDLLGLRPNIGCGKGRLTEHHRHHHTEERRIGDPADGNSTRRAAVIFPPLLLRNFQFFQFADLQSKCDIRRSKKQRRSPHPSCRCGLLLRPKTI